MTPHHINHKFPAVGQLCTIHFRDDLSNSVIASWNGDEFEDDSSLYSYNLWPWWSPAENLETFDFEKMRSVK